MKALLIASALLITGTSIAAAADSPCKGLEEQTCGSKEVIPGHKACKWIKGYKTVAGTERKSYCRVSLKKLNDSASAKSSK